MTIYKSDTGIALLKGFQDMKLLILLLSLSIFGCADDIAPSRSECITRIEFKWSEQSAEDKATIISNFNDEFVRHYVTKVHKNAIPPSSAIQGDNQQYIYLQYTEECGSKVDTSKFLVNEVREVISDLPQILFTEETFEPGLKTILVSGPYWRE